VVVGIVGVFAPSLWRLGPLAGLRPAAGKQEAALPG
jgi:hypothetical protein